MRRHRTPLTPRRTPMSPQMRRTLSALPTSGYALIVDGHIKSESESKEALERAARELKSRFPMLQIKIYDAKAKRNEEIALADA
jgi:PP-loop superfamily ATP-utilizing enzyme